MNGRGAVEIIVAGIALELGLITREVFSILVFMAILTTATVPFFLKWGTEWLRGRGELVRSKAERHGTLILGARPTARWLARVLSEARPVWIVDSNAERCRQAERDGLTAVCGNALEEQVLSRANAAHADSILALTTNVEVNALAASLARSVFLVPEVYVLLHGDDGVGLRATTQHLRAHVLFGSGIDLNEWDHAITRGLVTEFRLTVDRETRLAELLAPATGDGGRLPLAARQGDDILPLHGELRLRPGDEVIGLERAVPVREEREQADSHLA